MGEVHESERDGEYGIEVTVSGQRESVHVGTKQQAETAALQCHPDRHAKVIPWPPVKDVAPEGGK